MPSSSAAGSSLPSTYARRKPGNVIVWPLDALAALWAADPFAALAVPADAKPVVTFLRAAPRPAPQLPIARDGVCVARLADRIAFTHYRPHPKGPVFMQVIAQAFGDDVTTRTWATVGKVVAAGARGR